MKCDFNLSEHLLNNLIYILNILKDQRQSNNNRSFTFNTSFTCCHYNNKENQIIHCIVSMLSLYFCHLYCYLCTHPKISRKRLFNLRHDIIKKRKKRRRKKS